MHHQYHTIKLYDLFQFRKEKPASGGLLRKTKTKNSILGLKLATNSLQKVSQQPLFPTGGGGGIWSQVSFRELATPPRVLALLGQAPAFESQRESKRGDSKIAKRFLNLRRFTFAYLFLFLSITTMCI